MTALLQARIDDDDPEVTDKRPLDMPEMLSIVQQLLVAGNETTTKLLTETMRLLANSPDQWTSLQQDPSRAANVIEEALRLSTPTQGMFRICTKDHELEGVHIPKGARIVIVFASANRDEALFPDADAFDPDRAGLRDHLAFGKGIQFCLGAALSRLEGKVALEELARRLDSFALAESNGFEYFPSFLLRGLSSGSRISGRSSASSMSSGARRRSTRNVSSCLRRGGRRRVTARGLRAVPSTRRDSCHTSRR